MQPASHAVFKGFDTDAQRILASHDLTERQATYLWAFLTGRSKNEAAELAGYASGTALTVHRSPKVQAAMTAVMDRFLLGEVAPAALRTAYSIMIDEKAPAGVRANLALGVLDRAGFTAKRHEKQEHQGKDINDMSPDELQAEIDKLQAQIDGKMRDVTPNDVPSANDDIDLEG